MSLLSRTMPILAIVCFAGCQDGAGPVAIQEGDDRARAPLEITFKQLQGLRAKEGEVSCGVPEGREQAYDPDTGVFHVHFNARNFTASAFEVTKVAARFPKPLAFRLTGVPSQYGCLGHPLTLSVGDKLYAIDASCDSQYYWAAPFDKTLFRSQRKGDVVTVEFTEKGQALLKPGAQISLRIDTGW
jgi:hypothetical protein